MRVRRSLLLFLSAVFALLLVACEFSASTANIGGAVLARDEAGTEPTTVFTPTDTFYPVSYTHLDVYKRQPQWPETA